MGEGRAGVDAARDAAGAARLIAIDWGTTSLRAALVADGGAVLHLRQQPWGILRLPEPPPGGFAAALRAIAGDWVDAAPSLPLLACGMVGSAQGWAEAPYVAVPADARRPRPRRSMAGCDAGSRATPIVCRL